MADDVNILITATDKATAAINKVDQSLDEMEKTSKSSALTMTELNNAVGMVERGLGYAKRAFDETVGVTVDYANEVRGLQQVTGSSAEETSRLIQVLDDYKVSTTDAMNAQKALTKDGIVLTTDSLAELSKEYLAITNQADKNAFAQQKLGRNYKAFIEILQQGPDAIREMSAAVDENLVLTQKSLEQARLYEMQMDNLSDTFTAFKIAAGTQALPVVTSALNTFTKEIDKNGVIVAGWKLSMAAVGVNLFEALEPTDELAAATNKLSTEFQGETVSAEELAEQQKELEAALKATTEANNGLLSLTMKIQSENDNYSDSLDKLNEKSGELQAELDNLTAQGWSPYSEKVQDATDKLNENGQAIIDLQQKHADAMARIAYDLFVAKLQADGFTDAEFNMAIQAGITSGVLDEATAKMAIDMNNTANAAVNSAKGVNELGQAVINLPDGKTIVINTVYSGQNSVSANENVANVPRRAAGGMVWVGETGPELVNLPNGSNVASSPQSKSIADNQPVVEAIHATRLDEEKLGRIIVNAFQRVMR